MRLLRPLASLVPALCLALPLAACGGGGDGGGGTQNVDLTARLPIKLDLSGSMRDTFEYGDTSAEEIVVFGDDVAYGADHEVRGFFTFDMTLLPAGSAIKSAVVHMSGRVKSGAPYVSLGLPLFDWVIMGSTVSSDDFANTNVPSAGFVPSFPASATFEPGMSDVTDTLRYAFQNGNPLFSLRARFTNSPVQDATVAEVAIQVSQVDPNARPYIEVVYR